MKVGAPFELTWRNNELTNPPGERPADKSEEHSMQSRITELDPPRHTAFRLSLNPSFTPRKLAELDGVFCEPASAASLCGALRDIASGKIAPGSTVVCTLTGNGLKDPDIIVRDGLKGVVQVDADLGAVEQALVARLG